MPNLSSFDIFDTTLTRIVGSPHSVFLLMGRQVQADSLLSCSADEFRALRVQAEWDARQRVASGEVTLEQIYELLGSRLGLDSAHTRRIIEMEYEFERRFMRPVPGASERIQAVRDAGRRVVFSSDMYLPSWFLEEQLSRHGVWQDGDACYVSCEVGGGKPTGELFHYLMDREAAQPDQVEHWGDNRVSDVRGAKRVGIRVQHFPHGLLNRYEHILERFSNETQGLASTLAGASRLARLRYAEQSPRQREIAVVAAGVAAPVLTAYVLWLLHRAIELDLKRLYFVARDGEILLEIARRLVEDLNLDIELSYLYGSRQAWHLPGIKGPIGESDLAWILEPGRFLSVRVALQRIDLFPEDVERELAAAGLDSTKWDLQLSPGDQSRLRAALQSPAIEEQILRNAEASRSLANAYFQQEGLYDSLAMGIVDLGWRGRSTESLASILESSGGTLPTPFFFGFNAATSGPALSQRQTYLFDRERNDYPAGSNLPSAVFTLMEMFCSGNEGKTLGYEVSGDAVTGRVGSLRNDAVQAWGLETMRDTVADFVTQLTVGLPYVDICADLREATLALLGAFLEQPRRSEARVWGSFPYEDDQAGDETERLARPLDWTTVLQVVRGRRQRPLWVAGSIAISPAHVRLPLKMLRPVLSHVRRSR